jgi:glycosyltransferase involved in cell wall biosynthesis
VIAFAGGGALDTVQDGVTGVHFHEPTVEALTAALQRFQRVRFDPPALRAAAQRFDTGEFVRGLLGFLRDRVGVSPGK